MSSKAKQVLLWLMIISSALVFVWFLQTKQTKAPTELSIDQAITRINNKEIKEALFKQSQVEFTDASGNKLVTIVGGDPTTELLKKKINEFNDQNAAGTQILTKDEPKSEGWGWLLLIQALPFILLMGFLAFTLRQA